MEIVGEKGLIEDTAACCIEVRWFWYESLVHYAVEIAGEKGLIEDTAACCIEVRWFWYESLVHYAVEIACEKGLTIMLIFS